MLCFLVIVDALVTAPPTVPLHEESVSICKRGRVLIDHTLTMTFFDNPLPPHCTPSNAFLTYLSQQLGTCVPTPLALASSILGTLSIISWLFAQMPQIYKNYQIQSTAGLSIFFLSEWLLGDLTNLLGALFTQQATWQIIIATYYTFVDVCLVVQFFWYSHIKPRMVGSSLHSGVSEIGSDGGSDVIDALSPINTEFPELAVRTEMQQARNGADDTQKPPSEEDRQPLFTPVSYRGSMEFSNPKERKGSFPWAAMASPKTVMTGAAASLVHGSHAAPIPVLLGLKAMQLHVQSASSIELAGTVLSWSSTLLYLGSRLPQLYKNWSRKSTAGLSPLLFLAAFSGNFFYSTSLLTNPNAWHDFEPYGGGGWADQYGSDRVDWLLRATPFFLGAAGVLFMDGMMGVQFLMYGEREEEMVKVRDRRGYSRWQKVSGWMRGWVPVVSKSKVVDLAESQRLLAESREIERFHSRYGGVSSSTW